MINRRNENETYKLIALWLNEYNSAIDKYKKTRLKALIVTQMLPIIKKIAKTIARRASDPVEDLVQAGSIGLLKAIDSYSKSVNSNFKIYAGYLIIGEMKHYLRDKLNTIRVPRHVQELSYRINTFTRDLTIEELNELTNANVAEALNVTTKQVDYAMQADRRKSTLSLEEIYASDSDSLGYEEMIANMDYKESREIEDSKIILKEVLEKIPDEYKEIVDLYYYKDLNQREIGERLGMTQMQVSRKLKKAFAIIYKMIADDADEV